MSVQSWFRKRWVRCPYCAKHMFARRGVFGERRLPYHWGRTDKADWHQSPGCDGTGRNIDDEYRL